MEDKEDYIRALRILANERDRINLFELVVDIACDHPSLFVKAYEATKLPEPNVIGAAPTTLLIDTMKANLGY